MAETRRRWRTSRSTIMRIVHHSDEDKEFPSSFASAYDGDMSPPLLLFVAALAAPPARIALAFAPDSRLSPIAVVTAVREAAAVWSCCGIAVELARVGPLEGTAVRAVVAEARG